MVNMLMLVPNSITQEKSERIITRHVNSVKEAEGMLSVTVSEGSLMSPSGPVSFSHAVDVSWESLSKLVAWAQGANDLEEDKDYLLENGAQLLFYEVKDA